MKIKELSSSTAYANLYIIVHIYYIVPRLKTNMPIVHFLENTKFSQKPSTHFPFRKVLLKSPYSICFRKRSAKIINFVIQLTLSSIRGHLLLSRSFLRKKFREDKYFREHYCEITNIFENKHFRENLPYHVTNFFS
jgi:hypothetical protein